MAETVLVNTSRLFIYDKLSKKQFLIDTGSDLSILPPTDKDKIAKVNTTSLYAANGTQIKTYGQKILTVSLGLRRSFEWSFIIADVTRPIIGADFLSNFNIQVDLKKRKLIDSTTQLKSHCSMKPVPMDEVSITTIIKENLTTNGSNYEKLLAEFHDLTMPPNYTSENENRTGVYHHIETKGAPVYAKARRLTPGKYESAKKDFEHMVKVGICRPSKSP